MCYVRNNDNKQSGIRTYDNTWYSLSRNKEGAKQWGKYNIPIYTDILGIPSQEIKREQNNGVNIISLSILIKTALTQNWCVF